MPRIQPVTTGGLDDINRRRRHREVTDLMLTFQHDDSRVRTDAEASAGVMPINYAYPPGNVKRYGATGDGQTDDRAAFQAAIDVAKERGVVVLIPQPAQTYLILGELDLTCPVGPAISGFVVRGEGNINTEVTGFPATLTFKHTGHCFDCTGTLGVVFENFSVTTDTSTYPQTCFLLARTTDERSMICRFRHVSVRGYFSKAIVYNFGSENDQYDACLFWNLAADANSCVMQFTAHNIRSLTSNFTTIASGTPGQSCIDHKIFGGELAHEGGQTTTDVIRMDAILGLKVYGSWMMSKNGRSLFYVDTTNGPSHLVTLNSILGENQSTSSQKYGLYVGDTTASLSDWVIDNCTFSNITNSLLSHANVSFFNLLISILDNQGQGNGANIAGTLQGESRISNVAGGLTVGTYGENNTDYLSKVISMHGEACVTLRNLDAPSGRRNCKIRSNGISYTVSFADNSNTPVANALQAAFDGTNVTQTDVIGTVVTLSKRVCLPNDAGSAQTTFGVYQGSGAPSNANGSNGDFYFRGDTPGTANQRVYIKNAGTWTGIL